MQVVTTNKELDLVIARYKTQGLSLGFVPTMGFLHAGHASLVDEAKKQCAIVIVSIFVNPTQFGPNEDFASYPRDITRDVALMQEHGADIVYVPTVSEIYPENMPVRSLSADTSLAAVACGPVRPGHFDGVVTVVARLFDLVQPNKAFFGLKDYQQFAIIKNMVQTEKYLVEIVGCPIIREADGLAMSSRNTYLTAEERQAATILYRALICARQTAATFGPIDEIVRATITYLETEPRAKVQYVYILDRETLQPLKTYIADRATMLLAVYIGKTRLIDNMFI